MFEPSHRPWCGIRVNFFFAKYVLLMYKLEVWGENCSKSCQKLLSLVVFSHPAILCSIWGASDDDDVHKHLFISNLVSIRIWEVWIIVNLFWAKRFYFLCWSLKTDKSFWKLIRWSLKIQDRWFDLNFKDIYWRALWRGHHRTVELESYWGASWVALVPGVRPQWWYNRD